MNKRTVGAAAVFVVGCAVGGVVAPLVVPKASAQQAATLTKWEMYCADVKVHNGSMTASSEERATKLVAVANRAGLEGWEPVGPSWDGLLGSMPLWCFKRPKR